MSTLQTSNHVYTLFDTMNDSTDKTTNMSGKWGLWYGIHRGTTNSREESCYFHYDSYAACLAALIVVTNTHASNGYFLWFALAVEPNGTKHGLVASCPVPR